MRYNKDAYYANTELYNKKGNNKDIYNEGFYQIVEMLQADKLTNIYEVGFDFGQRLLYLENNNIDVLGGVEFDPNFGIYLKHSNLFEHGWDIRFNQLDFWNPINREIVITNNFLDSLDESNVPEILEKLLNTSNTLFLNENIKLDLPKKGKVYVVTNKRRDDIKVDSKPSKKKTIELPSVKSSNNRINASGSIN